MSSKVINNAFLALTLTKCYTIVPCYLGGGGAFKIHSPPPKWMPGTVDITQPYMYYVFS